MTEYDGSTEDTNDYTDSGNWALTGDNTFEFSNVQNGDLISDGTYYFVTAGNALSYDSNEDYLELYTKVE
jgi:hypothetical protein